MLKANVLNFSGMPEDQLTQLPPEVRQMVMTGTNALMNNAAAGGGMMPNAGMMMDMGGMMDMEMGGGGMGGMGGGGMGGMGGMPMDQQQQQGAAPKQEFEGMEGGMGYGMGMGMGEYGMQDQQQMQQQMGGQMTPQMTGQMNPQMQQQMGGQMPFQGMEGPSQSPPVPAAGRGGPPPFRGRGSLRGRGGFAGRGRGAHGRCLACYAIISVEFSRRVLQSQRLPSAQPRPSHRTSPPARATKTSTKTGITTPSPSMASTTAAAPPRARKVASQTRGRKSLILMSAYICTNLRKLQETPRVPELRRL